jgi:restriction system protein
MSGLDFEKAITRILKTRGFDARITKASGDGGVDIEIFANGRLDTVVQCKRYKSACGPSVVRELYGAMLHAGATRAVLICLGGFSAAAKEFAAGKRIRLVDSKRLIEFRNSGADDLFGESQGAQP